MTFLKNLLAPPVFDDEVKTYQAYLLNAILLTLLVVPLPFIAYLMIWKPGEAFRALVIIAIAEIIGIGLLVMLRRGFVRQAAIVHVVTIWSLFTASAVTRAGIYGVPYTLGNALVITVTGILLGKRSAQAITWVAIVQGGIMVYAQLHGWVPPYVSSDPIYTWAASIALFIIIVNMQALASNQVQAALNRAQTSEEHYRLISEVSSDYTFSVEVNTEGIMQLLWVAGAFEEITGYTFEEYNASGGWFAHLHPDDMGIDAQSGVLLRTNKPAVTEVRTFKKNGELSWVRVYSHPVWGEKQNRLKGIIGAVQDITDRKKSEEALTHERDLLQTFMDNIPDQIYFKDTESRFIRINKAQAAFLRVDEPQGAIGKTDLDFQQPPEFAQQFLDEEKQIIETGQPLINRIEFNPKPDGTPRWLSASKIPVKDSNGKLLGIIGISRDITQQKLAEISLAQERDILQIFMDNTPDQVYFKDTESRFVRINQAQATFLGIERPEDAIGKTDMDFQDPELARQFLAEEKQVVETGEPVLNRIEFNPTKDGKPRWLSTSKAPARNELGKIIGIIGMSFDFTKQKLAEEQEGARRETLEKVLELGKQVAEVSDLQTTLKRIWHAVHEGLNFDHQGIFLYDPEHNAVNGSYGTSPQGEMLDEWDLHIPLDEETAETLTFRKILHEENEVYVTHNYSEERNIPEGHIMYGIKDYAAIPLWAGDKPMGVITVDNLSTGRLVFDNQLESLRLFAGYAGLAIENARLNDAIQNELNEKKKAEEIEYQRRQILERIVQLGKQVTEFADLPTTLERIWHIMHDDLGFDRIGIFSYNHENGLIRKILGTDMYGNMENTPGQITIPVSKWQSFQLVLAKPDGFYFTNNFTEEASISPGHEMYGVKDYATVAAWGVGKPVAVITVDQLITERPITEQQLEALRLFAGYAGLALENARLKDAIQKELEEKKQAEEIEYQRRQILEVVVQLGKQVTEVSDLKTTLNKIWHVLHENLNFDRIGIFAYQQETNSIYRMLGTDIHGNRDDTTGELVPASAWHSFQFALERPNGFYFTHDFSSEANIPEGQEMYFVKDYATVAAWAGGRPVAIIAVDQLITQRPITEQQLEALRLFAGYVGLAIENSRLKDDVEKELNEKKQAEEKEQRRRVMLEKVVTLGQHVTEVQDIHSTLRRIWHTVRNELDFDRLGIYLYNPDDNTMNGSYGTSNTGEILDEWDVHVPLTNENVERNAFWSALHEPNGIYITHNYEADHGTPEGHIMSGVKDFAAIAAWAGNKPIAVICVDQLPSQRPITDYQVEMLRLFAGYAGLAIENARLKDAIENELNEKRLAEENEQRRRIMLEKVVQLGKQVTKAGDFRSTLQNIWNIVRHELDFDRVGLFLYNPKDHTYDGAYGTDREGKIFEAWHVRIGLNPDSGFESSMVFSKVLGLPDGFYFTKDYQGEFSVEPNEQMAGVKHYAVVAVWSGNKPMAIISVDQLVTGRAFTDEQLEALRLFAGYAGFAIENSRLQETILNELEEQKQLEESEQRRRITVEKVFQLGKQVTEVSDLRTTLRKIWHGVKYDLDFDRVGLFTYNPQENVMVGAYGTDHDGNIWDAWHVRFELDEGAFFYKILSRPDGFFFSKDFTTEFNLPPDHDMAGVKYAAVVAVWAGNKPVAIISVDQLVTNRPIHDEQLEALRLFAGYAGLAISNAYLNDALEEELVQKKNFIDELEAKNAELERFTYTASHDLKSPLVTITGFLGYLEKDAMSGNKERMKSSIARINSAAEKMQALLNDLLELSRIGRLMNPPENIPFEQVVHEAIDRVRGRLDETHAIVDTQSEFPGVNGDRVRLVEVVQNLIENAVKYAKPNSIPRIEIGSDAESEKGYCVFHVRDNGIGIDPQYHDRIFGLFNKLDAQSEGTGIGLSLVKRIIEVHGGRVWVESQKGEGATFYFSLPTSQTKE